MCHRHDFTPFSHLRIESIFYNNNKMSGEVSRKMNGKLSQMVRDLS